MTPVYQTKFGGADAPESEQGDCMRACLASIFEIPLEDAPDFVGHIAGGGWFFILQKWLNARNLSLLLLPAKPKDVPMGYAMVAVLSHNLPNPQDGHMVVVHDGLLVHDPNPANAQRPQDDYTVTELWAFTSVDPSKS